MKSVKLGKHVIPLWLIAVLLISGTVMVALASYVWKTLTIPTNVEEPLEIDYYPSELRIFPGMTEVFNITIHNHASINYTVIVGFHLSNTTYQDEYVTFSNGTFIVVPGLQNIAFWLSVKSNAPPINASLTLDFRRL